MEEPASQQDYSLNTLNLLANLGNWLNHLRVKPMKHKPSWDVRLREVSRLWNKALNRVCPLPFDHRLHSTAWQAQPQTVERGPFKAWQEASVQQTCQMGGHQSRGKKRTSARTCQGQRNGSFTVVMYESIPSIT